MKSGYVLKSNSLEENTKEEMELVNKYTRRTFLPSDVYIFSVVLCDNDIDRDNEMFTKEALYELSKLFVGKTGIMNHDMKTENQTARIISCKVEEVAGKKNSLGEVYTRLTARAYMPKTDKNKDFITEIDSGIKKEVSVSCSVSEKLCSVCGKNLQKSRCNHQKGNEYGIGNEKKRCYYVLNKPADAYEWSFVAVPAQKEAGVIKAFDNRGRRNIKVDEILKSLGQKEEITLKADEVERLNDFIRSLKEEAKDGKAYKDDLKREVLKFCVASNAGFSVETMQSVAEKMSLQELKSFKDTFEKSAGGIFKAKPQLCPQKQEKNKNNNTEFKI